MGASTSTQGNISVCTFFCFNRLSLKKNYLLLISEWFQVNWDKELDEEAEKQRRRKKENQKSTIQSTLPPVKKPEVVPQLPKPRSSVSPKPNRTSTNSATLDLLGLGKLANFLFIYVFNGRCTNVTWQYYRRSGRSIS